MSSRASRGYMHQGAWQVARGAWLGWVHAQQTKGQREGGSLPSRKRSQNPRLSVNCSIGSNRLWLARLTAGSSCKYDRGCPGSLGQ